MEKCEKCGFESEQNKEISIEEKSFFLCELCKSLSPQEKFLSSYLQEKSDWRALEPYRRFFAKKNIQGMEEKFKQGNVTSRAALGYTLQDKSLVPNEEKKLFIQKLFLDFLETNLSLNKFSKKYNLSINGLKKILRNFTYIGKVKFKGEIIQGKHSGIISPEIFNKVQAKLEALGIK